MKNLIVVDYPQRWTLKLQDVPVAAARSYLTDPAYSEVPGLKVFNLCRSYRYQSSGYYVSLLALARGHRVLPSISTIQDLKSRVLSRVVAEQVHDEVQRALRPLKSKDFVLSVYFGRNVAKRYDALSSQLFRMFPAPLLRAEFVRQRQDWEVRSVAPVAISEVPCSHRDFLLEMATQFFSRKRLPRRARAPRPYDLAILVNPEEPLPPSDARALRCFAEAARRHDLEPEFIGREDFGRLAEFNALFIRETTQVNHHTYRFARRAAAEGLVVIDDPESIIRCTNKVYLCELLSRKRILMPRSLVIHRDNWAGVADTVGFPCILKLPDSSYSQGVVKVADVHELEERSMHMFEQSDLIIAQEFMPTEFDWRIGILDRRPIYACKYYMAEEHWQIYKSVAGSITDGEAEALPLEQVPAVVLKSAERAARLIGDGLYGVDLKQIGKRAYVIEINDNPSIDAGVEDDCLKVKLYDHIMGVFKRRIEQRLLGRPESTP